MAHAWYVTWPKPAPFFPFFYLIRWASAPYDFNSIIIIIISSTP